MPISCFSIDLKQEKQNKKAPFSGASKNVV